MTSVQNIYISGPMRNIDGFNFPAFFKAEEALRILYPSASFCNPARMDVEHFGLEGSLADDPTGLDAGRTLQGDADHPFTQDDLRSALGRDLTFICQKCDLLVLLSGWEGSKGARAEKAAADALGVPVVRLDWTDRGTLRLRPVSGPVEPVGPSVAQSPTDGLQERQDRHDAALAAQNEVRLTSATGGQKGSKLAAFDQVSPEVERLVAEHFGKGARKYEAHNFRKGYPWSLSYSALRRHLADFWSGKEYDVCPEGCPTWEGETNEHGRVCINHTGSLHIVAVIWHAMVLTEFFLHQKEYDDRYVYVRGA